VSFSAPFAQLAINFVFPPNIYPLSFLPHLCLLVYTPPTNSGTSMPLSVWLVLLGVRCALAQADLSSSTSMLSFSSSQEIVIPTPSEVSATQQGPSVIATTFVPFPAPSSEPAIPGVYPASSPQSPPPVESPWLVPDFADAWTGAYNKAKLKVCSQSHIILRMVASHRHAVPVAHCLAV
jgi:hypothetical protein